MIRVKAEALPSVNLNWTPFHTASERWFSSVEARRSDRTLYVYRKTLALCRRSCHKDHLDEITRDDVTSWLLALKRDGNAPRTIYNYAGFMRTFFRVAGFPDLIEGKDDMPEYTGKQVSAYSPEQVKAMLAVADEGEALLLRFLVATGLREQEAMFAYFDGVDFDRGKLLVRHKPEFGFRVKDKEERWIPIPAPLCEALKARRAERPSKRLIFPTANAKPDGHMLLRIKRLHL